MTKTTFFSFIFLILLSFTSRPSLRIVLCTNQKIQRKKCNTRVTLLWTILGAIFEMWGNLCFTRRNLVNFIASIYIFPLIDCLLLCYWLLNYSFGKVVDVDEDCNICVTDERVKKQLPFNVKFQHKILGSRICMTEDTLYSNRKLSRAGGTD